MIEYSQVGKTIVRSSLSYIIKSLKALHYVMYIFKKYKDDCRLGTRRTIVCSSWSWYHLQDTVENLFLSFKIDFRYIRDRLTERFKVNRLLGKEEIWYLTSISTLLRKTYDANDEKEIATKMGQFQLTKIRFYPDEKENHWIFYGFSMDGEWENIR